MAKVFCVLYPDPVDGYPSSYARDHLPTIDRYPDSQALPTPRGIDFRPGDLLGSVSGELGLTLFITPVIFVELDRVYTGSVAPHTLLPKGPNLADTPGLGVKGGAA